MENVFNQNLQNFHSQYALNVHAPHVSAILYRASFDKHEKIISTRYIYHFDVWRLDTTTHQLFDEKQCEMILTSGEYDLLLALIQRPNRVLTRDQLMNMTRNRELSVFDRVIDVQISRLRHKIEKNSKEPKIIKTIRNSGYMLTAAVNKACL